MRETLEDRSLMLGPTASVVTLISADDGAFTVGCWLPSSDVEDYSILPEPKVSC